MHNVTPFAGTDRRDPFLLVFGRRAPSPGVLPLELPPEYAAQLIAKMHETQKRFNQIQADLERSQKDVYDRPCRDLHISKGKSLREASTGKTGPGYKVY